MGGGAGGGEAPAEGGEDGGREDWMTVPMGRSVVAPPAEGGRPDKVLEAKERAAIAAVRCCTPGLLCAPHSPLGRPPGRGVFPGAVLRSDVVGTRQLAWC